MFKNILVVSFILLGGSQVHAQDATQAAINEAGHMRIVEIKNRVISQREEIKQDRKNKIITPDQAKARLEVLDQIVGQVALIEGSDGKGTMMADDYDSYRSFLDVNASLIAATSRRPSVVVSAGRHSSSDKL